MSLAAAQTGGALLAGPSLNYTVKPGDKLIGLSTDLLRALTGWPEVARFNRMRNPMRSVPVKSSW